MKIDIKDEEIYKKQLHQLMAEMRSKGYKLSEIADLVESFRTFVQNSEVVKMYVFTEPKEVAMIAAENTVLGKATAKMHEEILRKIEKAGFCIGSTIKKARSQSRISAYSASA